MIQDYALDASLDAGSVGRLVRFTGPGRVGLASVAGAEVGVLTHFYGDGNGGVHHDGGPVTVIAGAVLKAGDRITSDGQGRAVPGGTFAMVTSGAAKVDDPASVLITVLPAPASVTITGPKTSDGKQIVLSNMFPPEVVLNFAGRGDTTGRYSGELFGIQKIGAGEASQEWGFKDVINLAGCQIDWDGGAWDSSLKAELFAPATVVAATPGVGNCNLVPTGLGFNVIIPAPGNGSHTVDVAIATPVPAMGDETGLPTGYWEYSDPWLGKGVVTPASGNAPWNLYDATLPLARFMDVHLFLDSGSKVFEVTAIKPKWVLPQWRFKATVNNADVIKTLRVVWQVTAARRRSI